MRPSLLVAVLAASTAAAQRGVPQSGFPSWQERTLLVLVNRSRAEPSAETNACSTPVVRPPLAWDYASNRSARLHSTLMLNSQQFMHNSPCVLASSLPSTYLPDTTCSGAVACACATGVVTCTDGATCAAGTFTSPSARVQLFGVNTSQRWGENIFYAYGGPTPGAPQQAHTWWLNSQGHCNNVNGDFTHLGTGYFTGLIGSNAYHAWTENFSKGAAPTGTLIAGTHDPRLSGSAVTFLVNYFDTGAPQSAQLNLDGACAAMTRQRGTDLNGTWSLTQTLSGTTCRRYRFTFVDPRGATVHLPEAGSYGVGGSVATCPDWSAAEPPPCPGAGNTAPVITAAAAATPSPVTAATTALTVLATDDGGEAALTYTWAATSGPAAVTFSVNGTHAASATTATFTRAGSYTLTATARDAQGLTATSQVVVVVQATPSTVTVTPPTAAVAPQGTVTFAAAVRDQFGQPVTAPVSWSASGGGSVTAGVFTAGGTAGGPFTVTATAGSASGSAQVTVTAGAPPTVARAARATPNPVTGTTTTLDVLGEDDGGEAALTYTWASTSGPAAVAFSVNGTHAASTTTATFTRAGTYDVAVTLRDAQGLTASGAVQVVVEQTLTSVVVTPATAVLQPGQQLAFSAAGVDQFGQGLAVTPTWSVSGGGTVDAAGRFTAGPTPGGPFLVTATSGARSGTATVSVAAVPPPLEVRLTSPDAGATLRGVVPLAAATNDDGRVSAMAFLVDGVALSEDPSSPFTAAWDTGAVTPGPHLLRAVATTAAGPVASPEVSVSVAGVADAAPSVRYDGPEGTVGPEVVLRATASDDVGVVEVTFELDGAAVASLAAPPWEVRRSGLAPGEHQVLVTARDAAGQEASATGAFTVAVASEEPVVGSCGCGGGPLEPLLGLWLLAAARRRRRW